MSKLIGAGKNGEVYPCPECSQHDSVRWLNGDSYLYNCDACHLTFRKRESENADHDDLHND